jgi:hypothetical protein
MKRVTRRQHVDPMATAWLIRRLIDPDAVFLYARGREVRRRTL